MNILIAGVYGVGKSYISNIISNEIKLPIYTASSLIKHFNKTKAVENIYVNQDKLIQAVSEINSSQPQIIIDGHFCIMNAKNDLEPIDFKVFKSLNIRKVILLLDEAEEIEKRLSDRDGVFFSKDSIERMQEKELQQAVNVCNMLAIPLMKFYVRSDKLERLVDFINN